MYAGFDSGEVYYQDAFGRTENEREFLKKNALKWTRGAGPLEAVC